MPASKGEAQRGAGDTGLSLVPGHRLRQVAFAASVNLSWSCLSQQEAPGSTQ